MENTHNSYYEVHNSQERHWQMNKHKTGQRSSTYFRICVRRALGCNENDLYSQDVENITQICSGLIKLVLAEIHFSARAIWLVCFFLSDIYTLNISSC